MDKQTPNRAYRRFVAQWTNLLVHDIDLWYTLSLVLPLDGVGYDMKNFPNSKVARHITNRDERRPLARR